MVQPMGSHCWPGPDGVQEGGFPQFSASTACKGYLVRANWKAAWGSAGDLGLTSGEPTSGS